MSGSGLLLGNTGRKSFRDPVPQAELSNFEQIANPVFDFLDVPSNITKSLIVGEPLNALKTLLPFVPARKVEASEITGTDNFIANFAVDILSDPTFLITGLGPKTLFGAALGKLDDANAVIKTARGIASKADELAAALKIQKTAKAEIQVLVAAGQANSTRAILSIGNPFGKAGSGIKVGNLSKGAAIRVLTGKAKALIPASISNSLSRNLKLAKEVFRTEKSNPVLRNAEDFLKSDKALALDKLDAELVSMTSDLEALAKSNNLSVAEQNKRLLEISERRHLMDENVALPDLAEKARKDSQEALKIRKEAELKVESLKNPTEKNTRLAEIKQEFEISIKNITEAESHARIALAQGKELVKNTLPGEVPFLDNWIKTYEDLVGAERHAGLDIEKLNSSNGITAYMPRRYSQAARALRKADEARFNVLIHEASAHLEAASRRTLYPEHTIGEVNELFRREHKLDYDFFETDIIELARQRRSESINAITRAQFIDVAVNELASPLGTLNKGNSQTVRTFLKRSGLKADHPKFAHILGRRIASDRADEILGVSQILKNSIFGNAKGTAKLLTKVEALNQLYRPLLTSVFPAFHFRNIVGNMYLNLMAGIDPIRNFNHYVDAVKIQRAMRQGGKFATDAEKALWQELKINGIVRRGQYSEVAQDISEFGRRRVVGKLVDNPLVNFGRHKGELFEDNARIAHYFAKKAKGSTKLDAMRSVNKYLFDYSALSETEKTFFRPTLLFYTWLRKNLPLQIMHTLHDPRLAKLYGKATGQDRGNIPEYLRGGRAFSNPFGTNTVLGSVGLPIEDLTLGSVEDAAPDFFSRGRKAVSNVFSKAAPALRLPIETFVRGSTFFNDQPISGLSTSKKIELFNPFSRFVRVGTEAFAPKDEETLTTFLVRNLTGFRVYGASPEGINLDRVKRRALESGMFSRQGFLVLPKQQFKEDPVVKILKKQLAAASKAKRLAKKRRR